MTTSLVLGQSDHRALLLVGLAVAAVVVAIVVTMMVLFLGVWVRSMVAAKPVSLVRLILMRIDGVNVSQVVDAYIQASRAGLDIPLKWIEQHSRKGGNVRDAVDSMIAARQEGLLAGWEYVTSMQLSGRDPLQQLRLADAE
ncbi:MAG: flotillin-like FloA family protein [Planctomycetota bacterium]